MRRNPNNVPRISFLDTWTSEKAWWWGALLGDGNVFVDDRRGIYRVGIVGSLSTTSRWLDLIAPYKQPYEIDRPNRSQVTYQGTIDSKPLIEWFQAHAFTGPKADNLPWPEDLPEEHIVHFLRGLWDTDGSLCIFYHNHAEKNWEMPEFKASFGVKPAQFVTRVRDELVKRLEVPEVVIVEGSGIHKCSYGGKSAKKIADYLYGNAPIHLRNEDRYEIYTQMCAIQLEHSEITCPCGAEAQRQGLCTPCWYQTALPGVSGDRPMCPCQKTGVYRDGLCHTCYSNNKRGVVYRETIANKCTQPDCTKHAAFGKDKCSGCLFEAQTGDCPCGRKDVVAHGLCRKCYQRQHREKTAAKYSNGTYVRKQISRPDLDVDAIIAAYKAGTSAAKLALIHNTSGPTIVKRLRSAGVYIRQWGEPVTLPIEPSE